MNPLSHFPITRKWPAQHPDRIQLYSLNTPNGVKASLMLEETGLPYEPHLVRFDRQEQRSPEYLSLNPYGKIPAIIDPQGSDGRPVALFESAAILIYLADKSGRFLASSGPERYETIQWVAFQVAGIGPMFGQLGFFSVFDGKDWEDKRPLERYKNESKKLLDVLNQRLSERRWMMGDEYTIADIAIFPLIRNLLVFYKAGEMVGFDSYTHVKRAFETFMQRPTVQRAVEIPKKT